MTDGDETRRIRHTLEKDQPVNLTGGPYHVAFPASGVKDVDADRAKELVAFHPLVEYDIDLPEDYETLRGIAMQVETDEIDGNSSGAAIQSYLESLPAEEREELLP